MVHVVENRNALTVLALDTGDVIQSHRSIEMNNPIILIVSVFALCMGSGATSLRSYSGRLSWTRSIQFVNL
jgi:hypothetical protein